jgi:hypothetical protein
MLQKVKGSSFRSFLLLVNFPPNNAKKSPTPPQNRVIIIIMRKYWCYDNRIIMRPMSVYGSLTVVDQSLQLNEANDGNVQSKLC